MATAAGAADDYRRDDLVRALALAAPALCFDLIAHTNFLDPHTRAHKLMISPPALLNHVPEKIVRDDILETISQKNFKAAMKSYASSFL
jgi:hypothetical protein